MIIVEWGQEHTGGVPRNNEIQIVRGESEGLNILAKRTIQFGLNTSKGIKIIQGRLEKWLKYELESIILLFDN